MFQTKQTYNNKCPKSSPIDQITPNTHRIQQNFIQKDQTQTDSTVPPKRTSWNQRRSNVTPNHLKHRNCNISAGQLSSQAIITIGPVRLYSDIYWQFHKQSKEPSDSIRSQTDIFWLSVSLLQCTTRMCNWCCHQTDIQSIISPYRHPFRGYEKITLTTLHKKRSFYI